MSIHKEVLDDLERSPHPLPWTLAIFAAVGAAILLQSLILAGLAGLLLGESTRVIIMVDCECCEVGGVILNWTV